MNVVSTAYANIISQKTNEVKMNYSKGRKVYIAISAILVLTVASIIFYLSAQSATKSEGTSGFFINVIFSIFGKAPKQGLIRTLAHFCEYGLFGFLISNLYFAIKDKVTPLICILISWGYAWTDEIHQFFVPGRACQLVDLVVDLIGIILGVAAFYVFFFVTLTIKNKRHGK